MTTLEVPQAALPTTAQRLSPSRLLLGRRATTFLAYGVAVTLSAALAFLVEPLVARELLPVYGGSAAVWATSLVFFQVALLVGYCAAHVLARRPLLQLALIAAPLAMITIWFAAPSSPPTGIAPGAWLLAQLAVMVGAPFVALGSAGPALQNWFASAPSASGRDPYRLYVASNFGSLVGLLAYPLIIEPTLRVADQEMLWTVGYVLFVTIAAACLVVGGVRRGRIAPASVAQAAEAAAPEGTRPAAGTQRLTALQRLRWAALAALPVVLLVGATNVLTIDVAAVPLLWVAPLAVYLVTLMVAFSPRAGRVVSICQFLLLPVTLVAVIAALGGIHPSLLPALGLHLIVLFCAGTVVHARLAATRPEASHLTSFYLAVAAGGAAGGIFASLIAPLIFVRPYEYPLALLLALVLLPSLRGRWLTAQFRELAVVAVVMAVVLILCGTNPLAVAPVAGLVLLPVMLRGWGRSMVAALGVVVIVLATAHAPVLYESRSFYGVNRVTERADGSVHFLGHGVTVHGAEIMTAGMTGEPLSYYRRGGPVDAAFTSLAGEPSQIAIIGLGTGSLAAYGHAGDSLTFYEIDPEVARIARDQTLFRYLTDTPAQVGIVIGDGRLELARAPEGQFRMVVLDAFSSDAVPVHLLTREAIADYAAHVSAGGVLLFNLSNRYVDLVPVVAAAARDLGLTGCVASDDPPVGSDPDLFFAARWAVLGRTLPAACAAPNFVALPDVGSRRAWTDDFSDILSALR